MSGDRLAQIAERAQSAYGSRRRPCSPGDVLALVEIAKHAQPMADLPWPLSADERQEWIVAQNRLRDALARLDSGATE